jgi:hypothetical protein
MGSSQKTQKNNNVKRKRKHTDTKITRLEEEAEETVTRGKGETKRSLDEEIEK